MVIQYILSFCLLAGADVAPQTTYYKDYVTLVEQSHPSDVVDLLTSLKSIAPDYFQTYLVGYNSRSLQNSSFEDPRIIMFSPVADMAVAFNGNPEHRNYKNIENMAFNYETDRFEFFEVSFEKGQGARGSVNPKKCLECHQSANRDDVDPRPNWEPYNHWPGFYGSNDDDVGGLFVTEHYLLDDYPLPDDRPFIDDSLREEAGFHAFEAKRTAIPVINPRYALLEKINNNKYIEDLTINAGFTKKLTILNLRRVTRLMTQDKELWNYVKWNIAAAKCNYSLYIPPDVAVYLKERSSAPFSRNFRPDRPWPVFSDMVALLFGPFGIDTSDWSMEFKTDARFAFEERFGSPNDTWVEFQQAYEKYILNDPDIKGMACQDVVKKAKEHFGSLDTVKAFYERRLISGPKPKPAKPLIQRCISCHVENAGVVPPIPFNDAAQLKVALKKTGYKRGTLMDEIRYRLGAHAGSTEQMPPSGVPSKIQKDGLFLFLESL